MEEYEKLAQEVSREAGAIMLAHFGIGVAHTLKQDRSPLTAADTKINELVLARIGAAYPEHSLLGEEGSRLTESEFTWVFDPIDGTLNFLRGVPINVFALALVKDGEPVLGVVYDPYQDRMYSAVKGQGAFMNEQRISVALRTELKRSFIGCDGWRAFKDLAFIEALRKEEARFLSYGSTIYTQMLVASGQIDGAIYPLGNAWDCASARVIIEEAGGATSDLQGNQQRYDGTVGGFIASGSKDFQAKLVELVSRSI